jgi:hypothetical protein
MNEAGLNITLQLQDKVSAGLGQVTKQVEQFRAASTEANKESVAGTKEATKQNETFVKGMKESFKPINDIRWGISRLRFMWIASFGAMALAVKGTGDDIKALDALAIRLGTTTEALSKKMYGFTMGSPNARAGVAAGSAVASGAVSIWKQIGNYLTEKIGQAWIAPGSFKEGKALTDDFESRTGRQPTFDERQSLGRIAMKRSQESAVSTGQEEQGRSMEAVTLEADVVMKIKQLRMTELEFKREKFTEEIALLRQKGVSEMQIAAYTTEFNKKMKQQELSMHLHAAQTVWGMLSQTVEMAVGENKKYAGVIKAMRIGDAIINTATAATRAYADFPWPLSSVVSGIVTALGMAQVGIIAATPMAKGGSGIVSEPTLFLAGEAGPESFDFTPLGSGKRKGGAGVTVFIENASFRSEEESTEMLMKLSRLIDERTRGGR